MKIPGSAQRSSLKFSLTPLIDVVFNLIIFFLAASQLARTESSETVALPLATQGRVETADTTGRLIVTIDAQGTYSLSGGPCTLEQLAANVTAGIAASSDFEVRIRTDRFAPYSVLEPVLLTCAKSGVRRVSFAVIPANIPSG